MATFENRLSRRKGKTGGESYRLDTKNKTPEENIIDIIQGLYLKKHHDASPTTKSITNEFRSGLRTVQKNSSESLRVSYLTALVHLCKEFRNNLGFTTDELMSCIRVSLVDESMLIRATALRVLRYLIRCESDVASFNALKLPFLVIRSMDLMLRNEEERAQALRVVRRVIAVVGGTEQSMRRHRAAYIEQGLLRCLAAVARAGCAGDGTGDRLSRPAIATLAEICVLNPDLFISCGGVTAVTRQLAECATPRMAEALCGVLLHIINDPHSRHSARVDLTCLNSPYCDFHFRPAGTDTSRDEREMRFTCSRLALLCVLRSWPGLLHFCHPRAAGGLRALVASLHLPRLEVRKAILDLLYELVGLRQPEWTDEISVALDAVDPSDFQDSWRLNEDFVAAEGIAILPHLSATGPDIIEIHLALLLQCFLEAGLLDGLAEVIVTSDTFISVRATVLLGQLLHLVHILLPPQICNITPALPALVSQASAGKPQALAAVAALQRLHSMLEARPASNSLFLDHIIQYCSGAYKIRSEDVTKSRKEKSNASMVKPKNQSILHKDSFEFLDESDTESEPKQRHSVGSRADVATRNVSALVKSKSVTSRTNAAVSKVTKSAKFFNLFEWYRDNLIKSSMVMQKKDGNTWNWEIIRTILKETDTPLLNLSDSCHKAWANRIINYLKPSSNKYSHTDLSTTCNGHSATRAGCQLIRHLLQHNDTDSKKFLEDFFNDVNRQIEAIQTGKKAHECLFSPQHMCNTMCQMYFLFIGQLCHSNTGLRLFKKSKLYENLLELATKTHHSCYVKLVISSLDYTLDACPRDILAKTLTCNNQASRLYATQFLNVLMRASRKSRELVRRKTKLKKNLLEEHWKLSRADEEISEGVDMDTWVLQMLVGQIRDESKVVVKNALAILEEAFSVPIYQEKMMGLRDTLGESCGFGKNSEPASVETSAAGDRAYLLWLALQIAATRYQQHDDAISFINKHLQYWDKSYNYRYVRLVEAEVHALVRRARGTRRGARLPPHALAALAALAAPAAATAPPFARALLSAALPQHYKILQRKMCSNEQEVMDLKASLWAVGSAAVTPHGLQLVMNLSNNFLEDSVPVHIVRLAKYCPVYSVRATAFYVLGLIGSTYDGANLLAELGWFCVRHTRHDQFPVISDDNYAIGTDLSEKSHFYVTSPDRRFNAFDIDLSEHSDHTDQSTAESLHSESARLNKTIGAICIEEKDQDVVDHKISFDRREPDKRKSHTLPSQGCSSSHERSLTESRTVDILRDCSTYERTGHKMHMENRLLGRMNSLDQAHEGRVRNTSESSTSGVSSCDSFLGKYAIPDRVLTLSPIPSSSSLYGMKSSVPHRPRLAETQRRISTSSFTGPDAASSPPTQLDMSGYATIQSLNKHRRPHVSEGAATSSSDIDELVWLLPDFSRRGKPYSSMREKSKIHRERMAKLSVVEDDWRPLWQAERAGRGAAGCGGAARPAPRAPRAPHSPPPHYMGICLPLHLADVFPDEDIKPENVNGDKIVPSRTRVPSFLDSSIASTDNKSRATPDSQNITNKDITSTTVAHRPLPIAITKSALHDGMETSKIIEEKSTEELAKPNITDDKNHIIAKDTETVEPALVKDVSSSTAVGSTLVGTLSRAESKPSKWRHATRDCLACVRTRPPSSHELREAFFADMEGVSAAEDRSSPAPPEPTPQAQLLHNVLFMSNPIHLKQTRSALLSLKQRHPDVFRSACVYSDVCALLARDTYMLCARRFLQELFLDTNFELFNAEPANILARHTPTLPPNIDT
ncbi:rapamycin-insensitive companion of mTOR isoform X2 [Colias croceus]|uniref:rapamycin-insensitive companion of mTOR isoform X2 n=1 Tax=Colias crocea TaxID=72248 RepID=UPI001E27D02D|nr:rapamycin-insensitive companion of mTOR isoform X2 [Colias croceus]